MWIVTDRAALAERGVLEDEGPGLFAMAFGAGLVQPPHGKSTLRLHDVLAVRIMALDAVHLAFGDGMMLGEMKLRLNFLVTLEARLGFLAGIDDELLAPAA